MIEIMFWYFLVLEFIVLCWLIYTAYRDLGKKLGTFILVIWLCSIVTFILMVS